MRVLPCQWPIEWPFLLGKGVRGMKAPVGVDFRARPPQPLEVMSTTSRGFDLDIHWEEHDHHGRHGGV